MPSIALPQQRDNHLLQLKELAMLLHIGGTVNSCDNASVLLFFKTGFGSYNILSTSRGWKLLDVLYGAVLMFMTE